jgi:hypothetical protein
MKVIATDNITSVTASEENANYPGDNVLDEYPKHQWKSTTAGAAASLYLTATSGEAVAVFNTNATSISIEVSSGVSVEWDAGAAWASGIEWVSTYTKVGAGVYDLTSSGVGSGWADYAPTTINHNVKITFTPPAGEVVRCGVVVVGDVEEFDDPRPTAFEGLHAFGEVVELQNGSVFVVDRDDVRTFRLETLMLRADWWRFLHDIVQNNIRSYPRAWRLVENENINDWEWVVYARLDGRPTATGARNSNKVIASMDLIEVL